MTHAKEDKTKKPGRSREAITQTRIDQIIGVIRNWDPKCGIPSGPKLEEKVKDQLGLALTYVGMFNHDAIKRAFEEKKKEITSGKPKRRKAPEAQLVEQRLERLTTENTRLEAVVANFQELFARHHYNAKARGMTIADLEAPIPTLRRDDEGKKAKR